LNEDVMSIEVEEENNEDSWWKNFFTLLLFIALITIIISSAIYGIFFSSREEISSKSVNFISDIFSYFGSDSLDNEKSEEKQSLDDNNGESQKSTETKKELELYWSQSNQKILQLEQKIENITVIVAKAFPAQIQPIEKEEKTALSQTSEPISNTILETVPDELPNEAKDFEPIKNFEPTWTDVGKHLITLEEEQEKSFAKLSESE